MITIISATSASAKAVIKINKTKYQILLLFADYQLARVYKDYDTLLIGKKTLSYKGTGADINNGRLAYKESLNDILNKIKGDKVIVVGYTGGGMSGGMKILIDSLLKNNKEVYIIITTPFEFEGPIRNENSRLIINELNKYNNYHEINYNTTNLDNNLSFIELYKYYDDVVYNKLNTIIK